MAWHKGTWWPLYVKEWYTPKASAHMFDPYSFCLVVAGLLLHLLWGTDNLDTWVIGFVAAVALELVWELIGNTPLVLKRIRNNNGACGEYIGTSNFSLKKILWFFISRRLHPKHPGRPCFLRAGLRAWNSVCGRWVLVDQPDLDCGFWGKIDSISTEIASFKWVVDLPRCAPKLYICVCSYKV